MSPLLQSILARYRSMAVAYSGGVDSAVLMEAAHRVLEGNAVAVLADSPSLPRREYQEAVTLAQHQGWNFEVLTTQEFDDPRYRENSLNRCYYCKSALFEEMGVFARNQKIEVLAYGENADDLREERWGRQAAREFEVISPLQEAGYTKKMVRDLAREWNLSVADKVASPCLSSRVPTGVSISRTALMMIEEAEAFLKSLGFLICRVRFDGVLARVMVAESELLNLRDPGIQKQIMDQFKKLQFPQVEICLEPYQGASLR